MCITRGPKPPRTSTEISSPPRNHRPETQKPRRTTPRRTMLTIIGRGPRATPAGTFTILRRVANETMDSPSIGIPRNGPGGYYLSNVLYTQYFLPTGQSIHYNYWSSNWGYPGSH